MNGIGWTGFVRPARLLALFLVLLQVAGLVPSAAAAPRPTAAVQPVSFNVPSDADVCALLTDDDLLRATGSAAVLSKRPGPQNVMPLGCEWELDPGDPDRPPWVFVLALQAGDGRTRFQQESAAMGGERVTGLGDDAVLGISSDILALKGDTVVMSQYIAFGGGQRASALILRALTWRALGRLGADGSVPGDPDALVGRIRSDSFTDDTVAAAVEALALSGVSTQSTPTNDEPLIPVAGEASPVTLLADQVRAVALEAWAGGGILGADLDGLVTADADLPPASYLVAGYVAAVDTPGARVSRALMGDQDWADAPSVVFPQLVLTLLAADVARERLAQGEVAHVTRGTIIMGAPLAALGPVTGQSSICGDVATFVDRTLVRVFEALKLATPGNPVGAVLVTIWNFAVNVAATAVRGIARVFNDRAVGLIAQVAATAGLVTGILSVLRPWTLVASVDPVATEKGYGSRPPDRGVIRVRVELAGLDRWPPWLEQCAKDLGSPLPKISPEGDRIGLTMRQTPAGLMAMDGGARFTLDATGRRDLPFTTLIDAGDGPWELRAGTFQADVSVQRTGLGELARIGAGALMAQLPDQIRPVVWSLVQGPFQRLREQLDRLIRKQTTTGGQVIYHVLAPTPEPGATEPPADAVWVRYDRPAMSGVDPLRILEFYACDGLDGPWEGVLRTGGVTADDGFRIPVTDFPVSFVVPVGGSTMFTTSGVVDMEAPFPDVPVSYAARVAIRGDRMSVTGLPVASWAAAAMASLAIEPAPEGACDP